MRDFISCMANTMAKQFSLSLFNQDASGSYPNATSATTIKEDWAYAITELFWERDNKKTLAWWKKWWSWIKKITTVKRPPQSERLKDRTNKIAQANDEKSLRQLQQEIVSAGVRENDFDFLQEKIATKIEQLNIRKWGANFTDEIEKDKSESDLLRERHQQRVDELQTLVIDGEATSYIDRIYNTWDKEEWEMLREYLETLLWQFTNEGDENNDDSIEVSIIDAIKYREECNKKTSLLEEHANLLEEQTIAKDAIEKPNTSWYAYTKEELKKLCLKNKIEIKDFTKYDYQKHKRLYQSYIIINNTIYWIERRNDGQWTNKLRGYLSVLDRKPSVMFIPVNFSVSAKVA